MSARRGIAPLALAIATLCGCSVVIDAEEHRNDDDYSTPALDRPCAGPEDGSCGPGLFCGSREADDFVCTPCWHVSDRLEVAATTGPDGARGPLAVAARSGSVTMFEADARVYVAWLEGPEDGRTARLLGRDVLPWGGVDTRDATAPADLGESLGFTDVRGVALRVDETGTLVAALGGVVEGSRSRVWMGYVRERTDGYVLDGAAHDLEAGQEILGGVAMALGAGGTPAGRPEGHVVWRQRDAAGARLGRAQFLEEGLVAAMSGGGSVPDGELAWRASGGDAVVLSEPAAGEALLVDGTTGEVGPLSTPGRVTPAAVARIDGDDHVVAWGMSSGQIRIVGVDCGGGECGRDARGGGYGWTNDHFDQRATALAASFRGPLLLSTESEAGGDVIRLRVLTDDLWPARLPAFGPYLELLADEGGRLGSELVAERQVADRVLDRTYVAAIEHAPGPDARRVRLWIVNGCGDGSTYSSTKR